MIKAGQHKRFMSYRGHQVWYTKTTDTDELLFGYAKRRDGTDEWFRSWEECQQDIDELEDGKENKNGKN